MKSLLLLLLMVGTLQAENFSVGSRDIIYTASQRRSKGQYWPDGNLGLVQNGTTLDWYAANGKKPIKTSGTWNDPAATKKKVKIRNLPPHTFNYAAGGPIYQDWASGAKLMVYHAEKHVGGAKNFYSVLGLAISTDPKGLVFEDLGTIVEPNKQVAPTEVGGGSFVVKDGYMYVYYRDWLPNGTGIQTAVARAPIAEVILNARSGRGTAFLKYYNGEWSQPGQGGLASPLEVDNPANSWLSVVYNQYLNKIVMICAVPAVGGENLYLTTSSDGLNWAPRQPVALDSGEQFYPTVIGTERVILVYYTDSQKGAWNRWDDAMLVRRTITFDP